METGNSPPATEPVPADDGDGHCEEKKMGCAKRDVSSFVYNTRGISFKGGFHILSPGFVTQRDDNFGIVARFSLLFLLSYETSWVNVEILPVMFIMTFTLSFLKNL